MTDLKILSSKNRSLCIFAKQICKNKRFEITNHVYKRFLPAKEENGVTGFSCYGQGSAPQNV